MAIPGIIGIAWETLGTALVEKTLMISFIYFYGFQAVFANLSKASMGREAVLSKQLDLTSMMRLKRTPGAHFLSGTGVEGKQTQAVCACMLS